MGIVVTLVMLAGLARLVLAPRWQALGFLMGEKAHNTLVWLLLLAGGWNAFWHGLRYLDSFWGQAGLASGLLMIASGVILYFERAPSTNSTAALLTGLKWPITELLFLCFLLYAVTLVRLNLGLSIIY